ncbi:hypothetical protein ACFS27_00370 [Promicromonospora vindobonensis]|uniref:DUF4287 domain-containing protein n=1 Tax=Promicromonospora vindobonensis TaxID=195748 RepID=A0ABW5VNS5_9MICO
MATGSRIQAVERATGRSWDEWLEHLARIGASELTHHEIASAVLGELDGKIDNPGWWAQSTTVAYEQYIGRRVPGQQTDGTFQTSVSRSTSLGMEALMRAWTEFAAGNEGVRGLITGEPRVSGTVKRITWRAKAQEGESVIVISEPKKDGTASLVVQHLGSPTPERNDEVKDLWRGIVSGFVAGL